MFGNPIGVCSYFGLVDDPRVKEIAKALIDWQWPDGGWNCDSNPNATHSSFYESLSTLLGLIRYHREIYDKLVLGGIEKTCGFFLSHQLFRSHTSGKIITSSWLKLHYPLYWHYDILQALYVLSAKGRIDDPRAEEALDILESKRSKEGLWGAEAFFWHPIGKTRSCSEVVDWGRNGPNEMITLNALRVLKAADRLD